MHIDPSKVSLWSTTYGGNASPTQPQVFERLRDMTHPTIRLCPPRISAKAPRWHRSIHDDVHAKWTAVSAPMSPHVKIPMFGWGAFRTTYGEAVNCPTGGGELVGSCVCVDTFGREYRGVAHGPELSTPGSGNAQADLSSAGGEAGFNLVRVTRSDVSLVPNDHYRNLGRGPLGSEIQELGGTRINVMELLIAPQDQIMKVMVRPLPYRCTSLLPSFHNIYLYNAGERIKR